MHGTDEKFNQILLKKTLPINWRNAPKKAAEEAAEEAAETLDAKSKKENKEEREETKKAIKWAKKFKSTEFKSYIFPGDKLSEARVAQEYLDSFSEIVHTSSESSSESSSGLLYNSLKAKLKRQQAEERKVLEKYSSEELYPPFIITL